MGGERWTVKRSPPSLQLRRGTGPSMVYWLPMKTLLYCAGALCALAEVRLPALLTDNAVLQAGVPLRIWGWADPGERVTVQLAGTRGEAAADAIGRWTVYLPPISAGGPHRLTANSVTVSGVRIGEVWVASGQSNMAFNLRREKHAAAEIPRAAFDGIRFFQVEQRTSPFPLDDVKGAWKTVTPETAPNVSAVAYYFARALHQQRKTAFGIIQSAVGGTPAEAWISGPSLTADPAMLPLFANWQNTMRAYPDADARYNAAKNKPAQPPAGPGHRWEPVGLFNGMIAPLTGYAIRGVIWYQGENNATRGLGALHRRLHETMIHDWRAQWAQGDFPFLWVQLPKFVNRNPGSTWAEVQEAFAASLEIRNTGMAIIHDLGDLGDVHPTNKLDVGERLARVARKVAYGENIAASGPLFRQLTREGASLRAWFDSAGDGLRSCAGELVGFTIAGADGKFKPGLARADGESVVVSGVADPAMLRYAWGGEGEGNLCNSEMLPASPFRAVLR